MPPEGATEDTTLITPYQGVGARGVNTLASKLLLALLPPNSPFFRLQVDDFTLEELGSKDLRAEVEQSLNKVERAVMGEVEAKAFRVPAFEAFRLLITTGNALLYVDKEGKMRVYRLDQYVIKRDPLGSVLEIIIKEDIHPLVLPKETRELIKAELPDYDEVNALEKDKEISLFTRVVRSERGMWEVSQECLGVDLPDSKGTYPLDESPWIPLRWTSLVGENYGRGLVEEYLGDLLTLETLAQAITEGSVLASRVIGLVNPNGVTRVRKLTEALNGDFIDGSPEDVAFLQLDKFQDFRIAYEYATRVEQRLSQSFLMMEAIQRDAERVTAEEVRLMAQELEGALGGIYSILSQEFQFPLVKRLLAYMTKAKRLPKFPEETVEPAIITGLEALGRGHDFDKLRAFMDFIEPLGDEGKARLNAGDIMTRGGTALGIDTNGMIRTDEEMEMMNQQAQAEQMAMGALPAVAEGMVQSQLNE